MAKHIPYIAIIVLLIVIHFLDEKTDRLEKEKNLLKQNELEQKLEATRQELGRNIVERSRLDSTITVLHLRSTALTTKLEEANKKLRNIPGSYEKLNNKELESKMIERWKNAR